MIAELASFNISVTDQSPLFQYLPYRDGPLDTSWNVSYSANSPQEWAPDKFFRTSESSHTTYLNGASVQIEWTGTAFWLYGSADPGSYEIQVDGDQHTVGDGATDSILFGQTDLPYGWHSVNLTVVDAPVSITGATLTVRMGEEGSELQSRNISTVTNSIPPAANPLFLSDGDAWSVNSSYGSFGPTVESYPRVTTDVKAASLFFTLNSTVGFAIYGSCDFDMGSYNVTINPPPPISPATGTFNASSHWIALNEIKYVATGLDRTKNYSVTVTNNQEARLDVAQVMVFDAVPA
ncbi:hypothetical protein WOLCODRAFT_76982 [Wolfiporia cocos MD-104 SS10]|uniref:Uncharacterized protein n=1 Tax=Wolfiporia cocos (strain MD-104) TaxID=742152 RepID=A0A2H3JPP4_WOLCO|nr:hypothetical protein WOLCODRAFT_76982 [Wolfiporia cocos MD-104 SS10]